jgi:hypothetical protein
MAVRFMTTYAVSAYHLWQVGGFFLVLRFPPPIKLTEILLKIVLNTMTLTITQVHTMYNINVLIGRSWKDCIYLPSFIYNIGVLTINIEFMWRGLERGERRALVSISIRFVPSHINAIFTVNTPILYLSCNKICKKMLFNLIIIKKI